MVPVRAPCRGAGLSPGETVLARLALADPQTRRVEFEAGSSDGQPSREEPGRPDP